MPPEFIVIAGPNGAGKSTTSKNLLKPLGIEAFDWDKEFHTRWKAFGFDPAVIEGIREKVNSDFLDHIEKAFSQRQSVAFETNFHSSYNLDLATNARNRSYRCTLYFLALSDPEIAIDRVAERVKRGGHNVDKSTIHQRFKDGLGLLDEKAINFFDRVFIYNSSSVFKLQLVFENKKLIYKDDDLEFRIFNRLPNIKSRLD